MTTKDDLRRRVEETRKKLASGNVGYVNTDWFFVDDVLEAFGLACMKVAYEDAAKMAETYGPCPDDRGCEYEIARWIREREKELEE